MLADVQYWKDGKSLERRESPDPARITNLSPAVLFYRSQAIINIRHKIIALTQDDDGEAVPDDALLMAITYAMGTDVSVPLNRRPSPILHTDPKSADLCWR